MKVNLKKSFLTLAITVGAFVGIQNVSAATLDYEWSGVWYERQDQNGNNHASWKLEEYRVDGQTAYCIEPGIPEGNPVYESSWESTGLSNDIKERVLLIGYYGYTYPEHQTLQYRAATQGMIWATILGNNTTVKFNSERWSAGVPFDISNEMTEIERLISSHYTKPSFNGQIHTLQVGESITLTDTNGVLNNYNVSVSGANYYVNGNDLTITPTEKGDITLTLRKNMPYSSEAKIFIGDAVQNMLVPGTTDPVVAQVKINSYLGEVILNKSDIETGSQAQGQATLEGAVYGIYNKATNELVTKITTDNNGNGKSGEVLKYGSYYLQEISPSKGYYLDNTRYEFDSKGQEIVNKDVKEQVIKNYISILKQYDYVDGTTQFLNAESNINFEIYYPDGTLFDTITTDKNGYASLNIPYGIWKFHQVNTTIGFEKIYDFYITVDENTELGQYYNILNNSLSAYLQVFKIDSETGNKIALANTTFKILNTDTNNYVSQYVGGEVYSEFKTDADGKFITYLKLESGNYKLIEVNSPNGYLINQEGVSFVIGNDTHFDYTTYGAFITVNFENTPIKGQVEINKQGETIKIEDGSYFYEETKGLSEVIYNIYADEDIKSSDGSYIYYHKGDLVDTITTNEFGYAISKALPLGQYYLIEVSVSSDYKLDTEEYRFELKEIDNRTPIVYVKYTLVNELKKGELEFTKIDLVTGEVIPNTKIEIYTENDKLIFTGITNSEGKISINNLAIGRYYIIETNPATGYVLNNEKVFFEITEDGEIVKANMTNKPIIGILEFTKTDISTSNPLPNTLIEIYNENDKIVFSGRTDADGKIIIEELKYGKYYIIEKEAPDGYTINTEKMFFEITEDGEIVKANMTDERIVQLPNTFKNDDLIFGMVDLILLGSGVIIYGTVKNKKKKSK